MLPWSAATWRVTGAAVGLLSAMGAGYGIALYRPRATLVLVAMGLLTVAVLMVVAPHSAPLWYQIAFLLGGPVAIVAGSASARSA